MSDPSEVHTDHVLEPATVVAAEATQASSNIPKWKWVVVIVAAVATAALVVYFNH